MPATNVSIQSLLLSFKKMISGRSQPSNEANIKNPPSKRLVRLTGSGLGFTLIELMIVVALISILTAIAAPSYTSYVNKQRMRAAQADLVVLVANAENTFQRTLTYPATTTTTAGTKTALASWQPSDDKLFDFLISASSATAFTVQAVGKGALSGCTISLTQANIRITSGCSQGSGAWL